MAYDEEDVDGRHLVKKRRRGIFVLIIVVIILSPILVGLIVSADILNNWTNNNDWIGFWGGYLGAIIGGIITLIVMCCTLQENKKEKEREEKLRLFDNLIEEASYISELQNKLMHDNLCSDTIIYELNRRTIAVKLRLEIIKEKNEYTGTEKPLNLLNDMEKTIEKVQKRKYDEKNERDKLITELCKRGFLFELKKYIVQNID